MKKPALKVFLKKMNQYLSARKMNYEIIVVHQDDAKLFNRGTLLNIGFKYAENLNCDYVVFHDVDMLPLNVESFWNIRQERPIERQGAWATRGYAVYVYE